MGYKKETLESIIKYHNNVNKKLSKNDFLNEFKKISVEFTNSGKSNLEKLADMYITLCGLNKFELDIEYERAESVFKNSFENSRFTFQQLENAIDKKMGMNRHNAHFRKR